MGEPSWPDYDCQCEGHPLAADGCVCPRGERALRAIEGLKARPMTPEQREWCLQEIASVEGYERSDYEHGADSEIAEGVLWAWIDFARDKGLLP